MKKIVFKRIALQVQTLLLAPICPHTCEHVWRSKLREKGSVLTAGWPQAPQPNTALQVCFPSCAALACHNAAFVMGCNRPGLYFQLTKFSWLMIIRMLQHMLTRFSSLNQVCSNGAGCCNVHARAHRSPEEGHRQAWQGKGEEGPTSPSCS